MVNVEGTVEQAITAPDPASASGIFSAPLHDNLLDPAIRLLKSLDNPKDAAILGESIVEEIYYRNVSEAGYLVGYNSPAQFSREYKRHFGFSPSAT